MASNPTASDVCEIMASRVSELSLIASVNELSSNATNTP